MLPVEGAKWNRKMDKKGVNASPRDFLLVGLEFERNSIFFFSLPLSPASVTLRPNRMMRALSPKPLSSKLLRDGNIKILFGSLLVIAIIIMVIPYKLLESRIQKTRTKEARSKDAATANINGKGSRVHTTASAAEPTDAPVEHDMSVKEVGDRVEDALEILQRQQNSFGKLRSNIAASEIKVDEALRMMRSLSSDQEGNYQDIRVQIAALKAQVEQLEHTPPDPPPQPLGTPPQPQFLKIGLKSSHKGAPQQSERKTAIQEAILRTHKAYMKYALGSDQLDSVRKIPQYWDKGNVELAALCDSLDTLYIAGLHSEFDEAAAYLVAHFKFTPSFSVSLFETTIRIMGGLLSAYALSHNNDLLAAAKSVADTLVPPYSDSFVNQNDGVPPHGYFPLSHLPNLGYGTYLSEAGSVQLENRFLSEATYNSSYSFNTDKFFHIFQRDTRENGLIGHTLINGRFDGRAGTGSLSDSYYEYLLKQWLLTGQTEEKYRVQYVKAADGIIKDLMVEYTSDAGEDVAFTYAGVSAREGDGGNVVEHLSCFVPGMLILGTMYLVGDDFKATRYRHTKAAKKLMRFCANLYFNTPTGLSPDVVLPRKKQVQQASSSSSSSSSSSDASESPPVSSGMDFEIFKSNYALRPETVESLFYMWRATGDEMYRDWGWRIFEAIEKYCRVCVDCDDSGYSEKANVSDVESKLTGHMDTFFAAETLKYLHLLFSDTAAIDLDCWVFNTEGHPFPKFPPLNSSLANAIPQIPNKCFSR